MGKSLAASLSSIVRTARSKLIKGKDVAGVTESECRVKQYLWRDFNCSWRPTNGLAVREQK